MQVIEIQSNGMSHITMGKAFALQNTDTFFFFFYLASHIVSYKRQDYCLCSDLWVILGVAPNPTQKFNREKPWRMKDI